MSKLKCYPLRLTAAGEAKRAEAEPVWERLQREVEQRVGADVLDLIGGIPESLEGPISG